MDTPLPDLPVHSVAAISTMSCCIPWSQERLVKLQAFKKEKAFKTFAVNRVCSSSPLQTQKSHLPSSKWDGSWDQDPLVHKRDQNQLPWFQKSLLSLVRTSGMWFCSSYVTGTMVSEAACALGPYSSKSKAVLWQKGGEKNLNSSRPHLLCCFSVLIWPQQG